MTSDTAATVPVRSPPRGADRGRGLCWCTCAGAGSTGCSSTPAPTSRRWSRRTPAARSRRPDLPDVIVCAHENLAVGMAHGCLPRDRQAAGGHAARQRRHRQCDLRRDQRRARPGAAAPHRRPHAALRVGRRSAPATRRIHWAQEMFDQAGMLREFVKWDYELRDGRQVGDVVDRALGVAMQRPAGPGLPVAAAGGAGRRRATASSRPAPRPCRRRAHPDPGRGRTRSPTALAAAAFPVIVAVGGGRRPVRPFGCSATLADAIRRRRGRAAAALREPPGASTRCTSATRHRACSPRPTCCASSTCDVPWMPARVAPARRRLRRAVRRRPVASPATRCAPTAPT